MRAPAVAFEVHRGPDAEPRFEPAPEPKSDTSAELTDLRFRALMTDRDWASLPLSIRRRFSKRLAGGRSVVYSGEILDSWMSRAGWWLVQAARLIGGPLPLTRNAHGSSRFGTSRNAPSTHVPSVVTVTEGMGGHIWTRLYARRTGFPQVIHSSKRFAGPTGLEEYVGYGVGMALAVYAREGALIFRSEHYFLELLGRRWRLPAWLTPGTLYVTHAELPDGKFSFTLQIFHPRLGLIIRQMGMFREIES
jgi:Domain of unknown function (DUF4166)